MIKNILLIEDDTVDVLIFKRVFLQLGILNPLYIEPNGESALNFLKTSKEKIGLIILDINMPKMNGLEFLEAIRSIDKLKYLPVIILSTSNDQQDICDSFKYAISGYMLKPVDFIYFKDMIRTIHHYWELSESACE